MGFINLIQPFGDFLRVVLLDKLQNRYGEKPTPGDAQPFCSGLSNFKKIIAYG
jgi:hypothetical protein